ncbi:MAG: hypothetical protein L3J91_06665, partial [Thermoplasmata archaeon]|nr:hypothetical protein [Thermoplasmata archaeon]
PGSPGPSARGHVWGTPIVPPRSSPVARFLEMDAFSRFDLLALNALDIPEVVRSSRSADRATTRSVEQRSETLLRRVVGDTEKPADIASLVHDLVRISYRSGHDPSGAASWPARAAASWGGLFYESRDPGGRRTARLADRLVWAARGDSEPPTPGPLTRRWGRPSRVEDSPSLAGAPEQKILLLATVQSLIDDLVEQPLMDGAQLPLPRLSEMGRDRGARELNAVFSQLFPLDPEGAFVIVDPRRYPGEPRIALHRPDEAASASPGLYVISVEPAAPPAPSGGPGAAPVPAPRRDPARMWDDMSVTSADWATVLSALQAAGARLSPPPPGDYRRLPGYMALRRWILDDASAGPIFDAVRWKDRPMGLILVNRLVSQRTWAPAVSTDGEYLEAELNHLVSGDPAKAPPDGLWPVRAGWNVRRVETTAGAPTYVLEPAAP